MRSEIDFSTFQAEKRLKGNIFTKFTNKLSKDIITDVLRGKYI